MPRSRARSIAGLQACTRPGPNPWIELRMSENPLEPNQVDFIQHRPECANQPPYLDAALGLRDLSPDGSEGSDSDELCGLRSECHDHQDWLGRAYDSCVTVVRCLAGQQTVVLAVKVFCGLSRTTGLDAVQHLDQGGYAGTKSPISFVQLRAVVTKDGLRWASWCTNPGCKAFRTSSVLLRDYFFKGEPMDFSQSSLVGICRDGHSVCECGQAAMQALCRTQLCPTVDGFLELVESWDDDGAFRYPDGILAHTNCILYFHTYCTGALPEQLQGANIWVCHARALSSSR
jgi:hypothetical protein